MNILHATRPLLWDNSDPGLVNEIGSELAEEYAYSTHGTAVMCQFGARFYVLAAGHVVNQAGGERALLLPTDLDRYTLEFDHFTTRTVRDGDHIDFVLMRVSPTSQPQLEGKPYVVDVARDCALATDQAAGTPLIVSGYPAERRLVADYRIRHQRCNLGAQYSGSDGDRPHIHRLSITERAGLSSFDSMSGSAVFLHTGKGTRFPFLGMLIQAGKNGLGHFIDCVALVKGLRKAAQGE